MSRAALLAIMLVMAVIAVHCSRHNEEIDLLSGLPPRLAELLVVEDDRALILYAREMGIEPLIDAKKHFEDLSRSLSDRDYLRYTDSLYALHRRVCIVLADEFEYDFYLHDLEFLYGFPPHERRQLLMTRAKIWATPFDKNREVGARIDSILRYHCMMEESGDRFGSGAAKMMLSSLYCALGDSEQVRKYLIDAIDIFEELGMHRLTCQSLGTLGVIYEREGKIDSMEMCFQAARDLAKRAQLSDQISRFTYFYACRYAEMGRLALANDLVHEAIELCKANKGGYYEIRFIFHAMEFYANYSCWETVERLLSRAKILERVYDDSWLSPQFRVGNVSMEARLNMARGNVEKANALFKKLEKSTRTNPQPGDDTKNLYYWARGLMENGRAEDAVDIIDRGLSRVGAYSFNKVEVQLLTLKAAAEIEQGDIESAKQAIERFDDISSRLHAPIMYDWVMRHVNGAKIAMSEGYTDEAVSSVEDGLDCIRSFVEIMDISVQGYLSIRECSELRNVMHELTEHDPELGYGAELVWRSIPLVMGTGEAGPCMSRTLSSTAKPGSGMGMYSGSGGGFFDDCREAARRAISQIHESNAVHCMYVADDDRVTRFMVSSDGIRRDVVPGIRGELHGLVIETKEHMSGEMDGRGAADAADVRGNLSKLGAYLLPDNLSAYAGPGDPRTLFITTDDFLDCIPFETFDIDAGREYVPLIECFDVAYLHHPGSGSVLYENSNPGIVIVNADFGDAVRKRYSLGHELEYVEEEGRAMAALDNSAIVLQGAGATKRQIKRRWEEASYLYFATHIVRDSEIPYLVRIPLAAPEGGVSQESCFLDFTDIRSADFSRCEVVVLSGCSSGAPSVATTSIGPSLGDAFLDGGAAVVIDTFWDVKDEEARKLMVRYVRELGTTDHAHIRSLCNARRTLLEEDPDSRRSFDWASYAIHIGRLPE